MICTSIQGRTLEEIWTLLQDGEIEMAEIRLDGSPLSLEDIAELFAGTDIPLVATCRCEGSGPQSRCDLKAWEQAETRLRAAIEAGAKYADLEIEAPAPVGKQIRRLCRECGTTLIRSYHNYDCTPPEVALRSMGERCSMFGGEIVKIVTMARSAEDAARLMWLYNDTPYPDRLIAFAMGEDGRSTRLECLRLGAPFTYAAVSEQDATAPGQWTTAQMRAAVYQNLTKTADSAKFRAPVPIPMPASKSFAQRAILMAALAEGTSHLSGYTPCGDSEAAIAVAEALGARVEREADSAGDGVRETDSAADHGPVTLAITGIAAAPGCLTLASAFHTGESGLLTRLLIPLLAVLSPEPVRVTGEKTLLGRPLANGHDLMASFGIRLQPDERYDSARPFDCYLPVTVKGPLLPGRAELSGKGGSQLISGLLTALPLCPGRSTVYVEEPRSIPYLFITLDILKQFGIRIGSEMEGSGDFLESQDWTLCTGITFRIPGDQRFHAADFRIEGDWSGAAPFLVAGAVFGEVEVSGLDTQSLQADLSILDILTEAGASISRIEEGDAAGDIHVMKAPLSPFETDLTNCPDLFPVVAVLAAFCPGESRLIGTDRLVHKETDRAAAIVEMLTRMGVPARIEEDCLIITGLSLSRRLLTGHLLHGGRYTSYGDHRMVMALSVAALGADAPVEIDDTACVAKSFPAFPALFRQFITKA